MSDALAVVARTAGLEGGLDAVGIAGADAFEGTRVDLETRAAAGLSAGMAFTYRNPTRSTDPHQILAGAQALVVGAKGYDAATPMETVCPSGRVARYARRDHYRELRAGLAAIASVLTDAGYRARIVADDNSLVDREAARRAGLGWYGKNANILLPGRGSWFVLGSVVTDAPLPAAARLADDGCGSCSRCITACPTGAIVAPGVVDARRCLAWLVQAGGSFPMEHRVALGDRLYGCDECQEVCPPNRGVGRAVAPDDGSSSAWVPLVELLESSDDDLLARHGRWYIPERDLRYLRRNALVALGNSGGTDDPEVRRVLDRYRAGDDALLAEHATWAAARLGLVVATR